MELGSSRKRARDGLNSEVDHSLEANHRDTRQHQEDDRGRSSLVDRADLRGGIHRGLRGCWFAIALFNNSTDIDLSLTSPPLALRFR